MVKNCLFVVFAFPCCRDPWFFRFYMLRIALECEIPTRVAHVATQGTMPKWQAEACSISPATSREIKSNSAKQLKNSTKHTVHRYKRRQRHQRNNGANSVSRTNGASSRMNNNTTSGGTSSSGNNSNSNNSNFCSKCKRVGPLTLILLWQMTMPSFQLLREPQGTASEWVCDNTQGK